MIKSWVLAALAALLSSGTAFTLRDGKYSFLILSGAFLWLCFTDLVVQYIDSDHSLEIVIVSRDIVFRLWIVLGFAASFVEGIYARHRKTKMRKIYDLE